MPYACTKIISLTVCCCHLAEFKCCSSRTLPTTFSFVFFPQTYIHRSFFLLQVASSINSSSSSHCRRYSLTQFATTCCRAILNPIYLPSFVYSNTQIRHKPKTLRKETNKSHEPTELNKQTLCSLARLFVRSTQSVS